MSTTAELAASMQTDPFDRGDPPPLSELRILVVEDQGFQRWALGSMLKRLGVRSVFEAEDGRAALETLAGLDQPVDVVVADLDMPGMDGMELLRHIAASRVAISVILLSGLHPSVIATAESMAQAYGVHVLGTMEKPVDPRKLEDVLLRRPAHHRPETVAAAVPRVEDLVRALDNDEFEPFFQPVVEIATGKLRSVEALARWQGFGTRAGMAPAGPEAFIASLESRGQIERLTLAILRKSLDSFRRWRADGIDAGVSLNLSATLLADTTLAERLDGLVRAAGVEPREVVFEITESARFADIGKALENLSRLRIMGFGLAIDDYGTGYSSLQQLSRIAFTELKIDRSFVVTALGRESSRVILESSVQIAHRLGMIAIAEGVESRDEWELLARLGCDRAQGYLLALPMSGDAFLEWAKGRRRSERATPPG